MAVPTIELSDGRQIPQLGFGVFKISDDDAVDAVRTAFQVGYRHVDTAAVYGNEEGVGKAIAQSGIPREDLWITTKLGNDRHNDARVAVEESLQKLGLDYVDLYLIHWPLADSGPRNKAWADMQQAQQDGLVESIGVSNFTPDHVRELSDLSRARPVVNQVEVHPTFTNAQVCDFDSDLGIATEAWSPLGQGEDLQNDTIDQIAQRVGKTPAQVVLRWHIQEGRIVIPKSVTPARIKENFEIFDFELSDDELKAIDGLNQDNRLGPNPLEFGN